MLWESGNAPKLGYGVNLKLYGQGNTANSEFIAWTRQLLDSNDVPWQTVTYKVGVGGGGTIGGEFSAQNIEVIDFGVPLLSIHTPYAVSSKVDVYSPLSSSLGVLRLYRLVHFELFSFSPIKILMKLL